ncbi:MAG: hypothetical protein KF866_06510 [Phycisphaeraceae bacterium]|nr:hypothetical protein [Phycisphaeraceae bacterium]MCW5754647.1 hypothetical protein [Phycisphaeraceae bacterium]
MSTRQGFLERRYFLLRRLHSLTGIVPIGLFLIMHLTTNSSIVWGMMNKRADHSAHAVSERGVATFQEEVNWINGLPAILLIEIVLWLSIAFHAVFGVYYARTGRFNTDRYRYQDNWRYMLQRITGYIALLFIFYHVATLRWGWSWLVPGGTTWDHAYASSTLAAALRGSADGNVTIGGVLVSLFYVLGVTSSVFHFANGLWTAAITWGITISVQAQRRWGMVCLGLGTGLMAMAWASIIGFATLDPRKAQIVEERMLGTHAPPAPEATPPPAESPPEP